MHTTIIYFELDLSCMLLEIVLCRLFVNKSITFLVIILFCFLSQHTSSPPNFHQISLKIPGLSGNPYGSFQTESCMISDTQEMKLLAEVDQPGSLIDNYVTQLSFVLSRKAAGLVSLQARLARFQHRLKEQEILSRKRVPR